jgi:hypothetical protein
LDYVKNLQILKITKKGFSQQAREAAGTSIAIHLVNSASGEVSTGK